MWVAEQKLYALWSTDLSHTSVSDMDVKKHYSDFMRASTEKASKIPVTNTTSFVGLWQDTIKITCGKYIFKRKTWNSNSPVTIFGIETDNWPKGVNFTYGNGQNLANDNLS